MFYECKPQMLFADQIPVCSGSPYHLHSTTMAKHTKRYNKQYTIIYNRQWAEYRAFHAKTDDSARYVQIMLLPLTRRLCFHQR